MVDTFTVLGTISIFIATIAVVALLITIITNPEIKKTLNGFADTIPNAKSQAKQKTVSIIITIITTFIKANINAKVKKIKTEVNTAQRHHIVVQNHRKHAAAREIIMSVGIGVNNPINIIC